MALGFVVLGFLLLASGLALWSVPAALVVSGLILFVSGGLDLSRTTRPRTPR